jgi:pimeloyl-ACP methyl ester carboxylesterase
MAQMPKLDSREVHFRIPSGIDGLHLFLRHLGPPSPPPVRNTVLYIHGATFPSALSIAHRFDGYSWRDDLNAAGFDVWGLDFLGFGRSDRYPEMSRSPENQPPLGRALESSRQIENAVRFILAHHDAPRLSLISHSWGSMPAGLFASAHPELVDRIVFFAPIAQRSSGSESPPDPAWRLVSLEEQWKRFTADVPANQPDVLSRQHFDEWAPRYLDSDLESKTRSPESVKIPNGATRDIAEAFAGHLAYDPAAIKAPVAIIRGEWDSLVTDADARWLFDALEHAAIKRDIKISHATHLMHLEQNRFALYREAQTFLDARDHSPSHENDERTATKNTKTKSSTSGDNTLNDQDSAKGSAQPSIPGYDYARPSAAHSPVSLDELRQIEASAGWTEEDAKTLQRHGQIFRDNAEPMVDSWRAVIGSQPHLAKWFFGPDGKPDEDYKAKIRRRFVQWVLDACFRPHDQVWLDYQEEIGLRHVPAKKNLTDGAHTPPVVPMRYLLAFTTIVTIETRKFFLGHGLSAEELQKLEDAWARTVQLHITLWSRPYVKEGLW